MSVSHRRAKPAITPYWNHFPSFFLYPFGFESLAVLVGVSLLAAIGSWGWLFSPLILLALVGLTHYCFRVLEKTAVGFLSDESGEFMSAHGGKYLVYKQILIMLIFGLVLGVFSALLGPVIGLLIGFLMLLVLPASIMVLAVSNSLRDAINPDHLWPLMRGIGMPYLGLVGCSTLLVFSGGVFDMLIEPIESPGLTAFLSFFATGFFSIVNYRLMGYVMYQYHQEIGMDVRVGFHDQAGAAPFDPKAQRAAELAEMLRSGRIEEALEETRQATRDFPMDIDVHERYHKLLLRLPDQREQLEQHARRFVQLLMSEQKSHAAVQVLEAVLAVAPDFKPEHGREILPLATAAFEQRRFEAAMKLMRGFDRLYPKQADTPAIYLLGARILCEHLRNDAQALRILATIRERFPDHPASAEAEKLADIIGKLQAGAAKA